jgi:tight adherence protein B
MRARPALRNAGYEKPLGTMVLGLFGAAITVFLLAFILSGNLIVGLSSAAGVVLAAVMIVRMRAASLEALFEQQFLDALGLATRSLRAGYSLPAPFRLIVEEMDPPVTKVFAELCQQTELGVGLEDAMRRAAEMTPSPDFRLFASAMVIQIRSGGNVADLMERLMTVIRSRIKIHRKVRVLTAQTQFSKWILVALPFFLFLLLNIISPEYMRELYTTDLGHVMIAMCGAGLAIGIWMMNRIAVLDY